ncbi:MAG TPA: Ig-like domain repeat protein [Casimicrobiaceae bacterium]|nr:Ig-like domain repeat protein [Casimicrobiaceae bacterium]
MRVPSAQRMTHDILFALTLLLAIPADAGRPGDLDPAFGTRGIVDTAPDVAASSVSVVLRQPDGKLIAVGTIASSELALARYNPDGTVDPTFGTGGLAVSTIATNVFAATLQSDGKVLVAAVDSELAMEGANDRLQLVRFLADGSIDAQYGNGGALVYPPSNGGEFGQSLLPISLMLGPDGKAIVSASSSFVSVCCTPASDCVPGGGSFVALLRFDVDGSIDSSYGNDGVVCTSQTLGGSAAIQSDGAVAVSGLACPRGNCNVVSVSRYDASGSIDLAFGSNGTARVTVSPPPQLAPIFYSLRIDAIVVQPDGKLLLGLSGPNGQAIPVATRLDPDGSVDEQFAGGQGAFAVIGDVSQGTAHFPPPAGGPTFAALQSDGKVVLASRPWDIASAALHFGAARFNTDGTIDTGYGSSGVVLGPSGSPASALVQADDRLVIGGEGSGLEFRLARFIAAPSTDVSLETSVNPSAPGQLVTLTAGVSAPNGSGTVLFRRGAFAIPDCAAVVPVTAADGLLASCATATLAAGAYSIIADYSGDAANPPGESPLLIQVVGSPAADVAVEYEYPPWGYFFVTSLPEEIAALDAGAFPGWQRTGESFAVYPAGAPLSRSQCRFFSGSSFAPKSSHFYSSYTAECNALLYAEADVWSFEGNVMPVLAPDASGTCPAGARPLYRLYDNGLGGAPNHRYTTSLAIRASMMGEGWLPEGAGPIGVGACVPGN